MRAPYITISLVFYDNLLLKYRPKYFTTSPYADLPCYMAMLLFYDFFISEFFHPGSQDLTTMIILILLLCQTNDPSCYTMYSSTKLYY